MTLVAAVSDEKISLEYFPVPVKFVREGRVINGWLEGYHTEEGAIFPTRLFAVVTATPGGHPCVIPISQLIDD
jgi:hypothetical protein